MRHQRQLRRKGFIWLMLSCHRHDGSQGGNGCGQHGGTLLTGLLSKACSTCFFIQPKPTAQCDSAEVDWALPSQVISREWQADLMEAVFPGDYSWCKADRSTWGMMSPEVMFMSGWPNRSAGEGSCVKHKRPRTQACGVPAWGRIPAAVLRLSSFLTF